MDLPLNANVISSAVEKYLNSSKMIGIPPNHTVALVVNGDIVTGNITAAVAKRVGNNWQVDGLFDWSHHSGFDAGFNLVYSK